MAAIGEWLLWISANVSHWLVPVTVVALLALRCSAAQRRRLLPLAALLVLVDAACVTAPAVGWFAQLQWNWQGKLLEAAWPLALGATGALYPLRDLGFRAPLRDAWLPITAAGALMLGLTALLAFGGMPMRIGADRETALFELTMPGIAEEIVFRGALLWICNEVFGRPWRLLGARVGWGLVLTTVLFASMHWVFVDRTLHVHFLWPSLLLTVLYGAVLGWVRERSGSLWPAIALHNLTDGIYVAASLAAG